MEYAIAGQEFGELSRVLVGHEGEVGAGQAVFVRVLRRCGFADGRAGSGGKLGVGAVREDLSG